MQKVTKDNHFLKSRVKASYNLDVYAVTVTLNQLSGFVIDASCTCKCSALGRCNHVAGTLFAVLHSKDETCSTSQPCLWNKGKKTKKDPVESYKSKYPNLKRSSSSSIDYDSRPPKHRYNPTDKEINEFSRSLPGRYFSIQYLYILLFYLKSLTNRIDSQSNRNIRNKLKFN